MSLEPLNVNDDVGYVTPPPQHVIWYPPIIVNVSRRGTPANDSHLAHLRHLEFSLDGIYNHYHVIDDDHQRGRITDPDYDNLLVSAYELLLDLYDKLDDLTFLEWRPLDRVLVTDLLSAVNALCSVRIDQLKLRLASRAPVPSNS